MDSCVCGPIESTPIPGAFVHPSRWQFLHSPAKASKLLASQQFTNAQCVYLQPVSVCEPAYQYFRMCLVTNILALPVHNRLAPRQIVETPSGILATR